MTARSRAIYLLPNLFTVGNLFCGCMAIIMAVNDALKLAKYDDILKPFLFSAWLLMLAMVFDLLDGWIARFTKTTSRFGLELDSLADLVSFGLAPALIIYLAVLRASEPWGGGAGIGGVVAALFVICGAMRLARYNVQAEQLERRQFVGLPIPAAGGTLASYIIFVRHLGLYAEREGVFRTVHGWYEERVMPVNHVVIPVMIVVLSLLMVSKVGFPAPHGRWLRKKISLPTLFSGAILIALAASAPHVVIFLCLLSYVVYGLSRHMLLRGYSLGYAGVEDIRRRRRARRLRQKKNGRQQRDQR